MNKENLILLFFVGNESEQRLAFESTRGFEEVKTPWVFKQQCEGKTGLLALVSEGQSANGEYIVTDPGMVLPVYFAEFN